MLKRALIYVAPALAMLTLAAGPAQATDGPAFNIHYFDDANHTNLVGSARAVCNPDPAAYLWWGTSSPYEEVDYVGECIGGVLYYF